MSCLFAYGIIDTAAWTDGGAELQADLEELPGVDLAGEPAVVAVGRLGVLVSRVPLADFSGPELEANLENLSWLEPRARAHAGVIAAAFARQAVLPMRFGTLFSSQDALASELGAKEPELLADLQAVAGLEEWAVRFCANPDALAEQAAIQAQEAAGGKSAGAKYLLAKRQALKGRPEVAARLAEAAAEAHGALARHARLAGPAKAEVTGLAGGRRSLDSRVYLIEQARRPDFLAELERAAGRAEAAGLSALVSGPWPPAPEAV
ncbi:MAG TPA: GvpL/GvpF family gas vesicle protein [Symbiobacteriaceae bacterium]|jgi:hypothetical protein